MRHDVRLIAIVVLVAVLAGLWLLRDHSPSVDSQAVVNSTSERNGRLNDARGAGIDESDEHPSSTDMRRFNALRDAVSTLHNYMVAVSNGDAQEVAGFWLRSQLPGDSGEADLHSLKDLRALKTINGEPQSLDQATATEGVPDAIQIPVTLRIQPQSGGGRTYSGWYRMRRAPSGTWVITSASIRRGDD